MIDRRPQHTWNSQRCILALKNAEFLVLDRVHEFLHFRETRKLPTNKAVHLIAWTFLSYPPFIKINVDGAATSNPGNIAIGGIARNSVGEWVFAFSKTVGHGTVLKGGGGFSYSYSFEACKLEGLSSCHHRVGFLASSEESEFCS